MRANSTVLLLREATRGDRVMYSGTAEEINANAAATRQLLSIIYPLRPVANLVRLKIDRAASSEQQLAEVMTDFWFNHFNIDYRKDGVTPVVDDYEDVIWRHVFGRFEDMLIATARHPAMLAYLDNAANKYPDGLNENYARELMELHTLGVDGGYTQQDVVEVARAFTGWTTYMSARATFEFRPYVHDPGSKVVLGRTLAGGRGMEDGLDVLHMLARHPATARHVATKLVRHFVADDPPPELVQELERVFLATDGDLKQVTRALFESDAFYQREYYQAKVKRPFEFVASAVRLTGLSNVAQLPGASLELGLFAFPLYAMGHLPYAGSAPTGYPSSANEWVSAGAMIGRMDFAWKLTEGNIGGFLFDPVAALRWIAEAAGETPGSPPASPEALADAVLGQVMYERPADALRASIVADLARQTEMNSLDLAARALALAVGSPQFQRY
jgi:uncharacterized protein (DUF1800 family)